MGFKLLQIVGKFRQLLLQLCLALLLLTLPTSTQKMETRSMELSDPDRVAIRSVIQSQLEAFRRDDAKTAFSFASPTIQEKFGTPENFLLMVREAYPAVYRPRSVMFDSFTFLQGTPVQQVILLSPDGKLIKALYLMEKQTDRSWRIVGCLLTPLEGRTV